MVPLKLNKGRKSILDLEPKSLKDRFGRGGKKMRKSILIAILFLFFVSFMSLDAQWARTYGGSKSDGAYSIQQTIDNGYIVAGYTKSFGAGYKAFWILKLYPDGNIEWQKTYGGVYYEEAYWIQQTTDNGYIVAARTTSFGSNFWILKLYPDGNIEWQKLYDLGGNDVSYVVQQTSDNGYIVAGYTYFAGYNVLKLDPDGNIEWQKTYKRSNKDTAYSIQQTTDNGYIVAGYTVSSGFSYDFWILKLYSDGNIEWQKTYGGIDEDSGRIIQQTTDGGYIVAGYTKSFGAGNEDIWILKLDPDGNIEWQKTYGGGDWDMLKFIRQTSDEGYIVAGSSNSFIGCCGFWVLKLDLAGNIEWEKTYAGHEYDWDVAYSIQETNEGGYIVAGYTFSFGAGEADMLILKLFPDGDIHSSCGFIEDSNATITDTSIFPVDTSATPQEVSVTVLDTIVFPQDSDGIVTLLCECPRYSLTISATSGGTTDPEPDAYAHYEGTEITITATADEDYIFKEWLGDVPSGHEQDNPLTITMDSDKSITANFVQQRTLTIIAGTGGTTSPIPGTYTYGFGTNVSIQATANSGYRFTNWTGDASGTTNPITITIDSDKSVTANFEVIPEPPKPPEPEPEKNGCFIATAAYGSSLHPHIDVLREFRDKHLITNKPGRTFVNFYYKYSPPIANFISKHKFLKIAVRIHLCPVVAFTYLIVH